MADTKEIAVKAGVDIGDNLTQLLEKLAHQIGTTADKVFPWYVQQQILSGIVGLIWTAVIFAIGLFLYRAAINKAEWSDYNRYTFFSVVGVVIMSLAFICIMFNTEDSIKQIMNPNYYALKAMTNDMAKLLGK